MASDDDRVGLTRYWLEFELPPPPSPPRGPGITIDGGEFGTLVGGLRQGVGVSGHDLEDCLTLIRQCFEVEELPPVRHATADVDLAALPQPVPDPGASIWRGVWYPALPTMPTA